jgi:hypothetical protein
MGPVARRLEAGETGPMTDRDVYLKLAAVAEELMRLSGEAESLVGEAALQTAASTVAGTAKAVYEHVLGSEGTH